jgi:hypothetical protein
VLIGDLALFGNRYVATLKMLRADTAQAISIQSVEAGNESDFLEALRGAAARLSADTLRTFGGEPVKLASSSGGSGFGRGWALLPAVIGLASAIATPILFGQAQSRYSLLVDNSRHVGFQEGLDARDQGRGLQTGAWVTTVTAGVMLAAAALIWFVLGDKP